MNLEQLVMPEIKYVFKQKSVIWDRSQFKEPQKLDELNKKIDKIVSDYSPKYKKKNP